MLLLLSQEEKFRRIKLTNPKIQSAIVSVEGAVDALLAMGWALDESDPDFLSLPAGVFLSMKEVCLDEIISTICVVQTC